jgi:hypothetical protein
MVYNYNYIGGVRWIVACALVFCLLFFLSRGTDIRLASALTNENVCKTEVATQVKVISGSDNTESKLNFTSQFESIVSTAVPTHYLLGEVRALLKGKRLEFDALCSAVSKGNEMSGFERDAFSLDSCSKIDSNGFAAGLLKVREFCDSEASVALDGMFETVKVQLMRDALEESTRLLVETYKRINSKLPGLLEEHSRFVKNILTLSRRLGPFVLTEPD